MLEVDMHVHSHFSDGADSPTEVVRKAKNAGLKAVCLTDHDTYCGLQEFVNALHEFKMDGLPSIEVTSVYNGQVVHILGYGIDYSQTETLEKTLTINQEALNSRMKESLEAYKQAGIMDISIEEMNEVTGCKGQIGQIVWLRDYRVRFCGLSKKDAKAETLLGGIAYETYAKAKLISPVLAIQLIKSLGGFAVWAHPGQVLSKIQNKLFLELLSELVSSKLDGLEVFHPTQPRLQTELFFQLASQNKLIKTGGSDFHGRHKPRISLGDFGIDYDCFKQIKRALRG